VIILIKIIDGGALIYFFRMPIYFNMKVNTADAVNPALRADAVRPCYTPIERAIL